MKQAFIRKAFRPSTMHMILTAASICEEYAAQGYDLSLRQLYYQFVSRGLLENTEGNYKRLGSIISNARLAGLIDWEYIKDRGRKKEENSHWTNPSEILDVCAEQFRIDTWEDQPNRVFVMVEKQALQGVLEPVCKKLDVPFIANKGYSSSSSMYEIGREFRRRIDERERAVGPGNVVARREHGELLTIVPHVIYLGDHDPSGIDMSRDVEERLTMFAEAEVIVHRIALNMDQVEHYGPPENPTKLTDSRAAGYIEKFGHSSWELDALDPSILASLVTKQVEALRDDTLYGAKIEKQDAWRAELAKLADKYKG